MTLDHMGVSVRRMRTEDAKKVALLEEKIFSRPWSEASFRKALEMPEQILLVAEKGEICGYGVLFVAADQADISNIAVDPAFRGCGIGASLMREMLSEARAAGVKEVFLEVRESNVPAIALYHKYGFRQIGVRKAYYEAPREDALLMKAELQMEMNKQME